MNRLSLTGWIVSLVLNLLCVALLSGTHGVAWWVIRVWQSDSSAVLQCDRDISLLLYRGACTQSKFGGASTDHCVGFGDDEQWRSFDAFLNGETSLNTQSADMAQGAEHALSASETLSAALAFSVITVVVHLVSLALLLRMKTQYKILQIIATGAVVLSIVLAIVSLALASSGNNDLMYGPYWQLLLCPNPYVPDESYANSYITTPFAGFFFAIITILLQVGSLRYLVFSSQTEEVAAPLVPSSTPSSSFLSSSQPSQPSQPPQAVPAVPAAPAAVVWVESQPVKSEDVQYVHTAP